MILNAQDNPVTINRVTHALTKITCFCECAKGGDIRIDAFVFLLISEGFVQFSDGEFVELL